MYPKSEKEIMQSWGEGSSHPVVSICCITYNHKDFIAQAIDSFLMQETGFPFEILIHDDASTDGTSEVIKDYVSKFPKIIKLVLQEKNLYSQGLRLIAPKFLFPLVRAKYIALCEGDDYWISENKLNKQFDFMESHKEFSCCFHAVTQLDETKTKRTKVASIRLPKGKREFYFEDTVKSYLIPTASLFFRTELLPEKYFETKKTIYGDIYIQLLLTSQGPAYYFDEIMGVYRHHDGGVSKGLNPLTSMDNAVNVYTEIDTITKGRYHKLLNKRIAIYKDYCYSRHFLSERKFFKGGFYLFRLLIKHPMDVVTKLSDRVL
jgi:glycosyltransferase involved in cell wall biosynthesis